jgi:glucosamine--fructose-6-phosphate aminotransferase (isomerizing)
MMGKGNHRHFMLKEIHEQPAVIGDTLQSYRRIRRPGRSTLPAVAVRLEEGEPHHHDGPVARAFYACMVAKYWFEQIARLPVEVELASEFRYRAPPLPEGRRLHRGVAVGRDCRHAGGGALRQGRRSRPMLSQS